MPKLEEVNYENKVEFNIPELEDLIVQEGLLGDGDSPKKTVYFIDNIHAHIFFVEPISGDKKQYQITYFDKEHYNPLKIKDGDFSVQFIYNPEDHTFTLTGITEELKNNENINEVKKQINKFLKSLKQYLN